MGCSTEYFIVLDEDFLFINVCLLLARVAALEIFQIEMLLSLDRFPSTIFLEILLIVGLKGILSYDLCLESYFFFSIYLDWLYRLVNGSYLADILLGLYMGP